jgi:hypothetical protein
MVRLVLTLLLLELLRLLLLVHVYPNPSSRGDCCRVSRSGACTLDYEVLGSRT